MSQLSSRVMRRVRLIWFMKTFAPAGIKAGVLAAGLWLAGSYVSYANVWQNFQGKASIAQAYTFMKSAFLETEFVVQILAVLLAVIAILLIRDIARNITAAHPAHA